MPFEFKVSFAAQYIDFDQYVSELQRSLRRLMRETAAVYYNNLILRLPVDTGFLAGSFGALKRASGAQANPFPPVGRQSRTRSIYTHFGADSTPKNPTSGERYATPEEEILTEVTDNETRYLLIFQFNNAIRYYPINDLYGTLGRSAWHYTDKATRAALAYLNANLAGILPQVLKISVKQQLISYKPGQPAEKIKIRR